MLIIARTTGVQTVVMNGNSNLWVIRYCLGRNGKTEQGHLPTPEGWKAELVYSWLTHSGQVTLKVICQR